MRRTEMHPEGNEISDASGCTRRGLPVVGGRVASYEYRGALCTAEVGRLPASELESSKERFHGRTGQVRRASVASNQGSSNRAALSASGLDKGLR